MQKPVHVIPCLDVKDGRVVKGVNFVDLRDAGDPLENALRYEQQGADELVFLDIAATTEKRDTMVTVIRAVAQNLSIPLTVGGGIRTLDDVQRLIDAGVSKVSFNSAAVARPELVAEVAAKHGQTMVVVAIDAQQRTGAALSQRGPGWDVMTHGGGKNTELDVLAWARQMADAGAGSILLTSVDRDGRRDGFDLALTRAVSDAVAVPVTASGGAGTLQDLADGVLIGGASAVLAASIFHDGRLTVGEVKQFMAERGIAVQLQGVRG